MIHCLYENEVEKSKKDEILVRDAYSVPEEYYKIKVEGLKTKKVDKVDVTECTVYQ